MDAMKTRILLINFTEEEAKKLTHFDIPIERGYISDVSGYLATESLGDKDEMAEYYFPHPAYEYRVVIINFNKNSAVKAEFDSKIKNITKEIRLKFFDFWQKQGIL